MQGEERGVGTDGDTSSSKDPSQGKVVGRVMSTQIPTSLLTSTKTTSTTMTLKPFNKGVVIGSSAEGSSSKPPLSKEEIQ